MARAICFLSFAPMGAFIVAGLLNLPARAGETGGSEKSVPPPRLDRKTPVDFENEILPFFRLDCLPCHNQTKAKAHLVLETPQTILKGSENGPVVAPGRAEESLLFRAAAHEIADTIMPPPENKVNAAALTPEQLALLKLWIDQGAKGQLRREIQVHWRGLPENFHPVYALAFTPDGRYAAVGRGNRIFIYQLRSRQFLVELTDPDLAQDASSRAAAQRDLVHCLAFDPNGTALASGGYREAKIWERQPRAVCLEPNVTSTITAFSLSPDRKWLALGQENGRVALWDLEGRKLLGSFSTGSNRVAQVKLSPDKRLLAVGAAQEAALFEAVEGGPICRARFTTNVIALAWLPRKLVVATADGLLGPWPVSPGTNGAWKASRQLKVEGLLALASASEDSVFASLANAKVEVWNVQTGRKIREFQAHTPLASIIPSRDGKTLAGLAKDGSLQLYNLAAGKLLFSRRGDPRLVERIAQIERREKFASNEQAYAKSALDNAQSDERTQREHLKKAGDLKQTAEKELGKGRKKLDSAKESKNRADTNLAQLKEEFRKATDHYRAAEKAAQTALATAKTALAKAQSRATNEHQASVNELLEKLVASAKSAGAAKAEFDRLTAGRAAKEKQLADKAKAAAKALAQAEKEFQKLETAQNNAAKDLELIQRDLQRATDNIAKDKQALSTAGTNLAARKTELDRAQHGGPGSVFNAIALSPDSRSLAIGLTDGAVCLLSSTDGSILAEASSWPGTAGIAFVSQNKLLICGPRAVRVIDWRPQWRLAARLGTGSSNSPIIDRVQAVAFSPDGKWLATGGGEPSRGGEINIWDWRAGRLAHGFTNVHSDTVFGLAFSPDGKFLASGAADKFVRVTDPKTGQVVKNFEGHQAHVLDVSWNADGRTLASSSADGFIKIWNFPSGQLSKTIGASEKEITSVQFVGSTSGLLATTGDNRLRWFEEDGREIRSFSGANDYLYCAAATPDGAWVAAGGQDGIVRVWNGHDGKALGQLSPPVQDEPGGNAPEAGSRAGTRLSKAQ